jgi:hypothetical protein
MKNNGRYIGNIDLPLEGAFMENLQGNLEVYVPALIIN